MHISSHMTSMLSQNLGEANFSASTFCAAIFSNDECGANGLPLTPNSIRILGRFQKLKALDHYNLCKYLDIHRDNHERLVIVSEDYEKSLAKIERSTLVANNGELLLQMTCQILQALDYLNQENLVHRNLSPLNILYDSKGCVKLSGYGMYYMTNCGRAVSFPIGCPNYLSPEVVLQGLNPLEDDSIILSGLKADIWSLGIILLEVLMGQSVYAGLTLQQKFYRIISFVQMTGKSVLLNLIEEFDGDKKSSHVENELICIVEKCLQPCSERPTAAELLKEPVFIKLKQSEMLISRTGLRFFAKGQVGMNYIDSSPDFSVDDDPLCQQDIDLVYYWWKLAGGDLRSVLSKAGLLLNRPPITKLANFVPVEGEMFGEIKDQSSLLNTRRAVLSLDQLKLRLKHFSLSDYYPLLEEDSFKLTEQVNNDDRHDAAKLPLVIKEKNVEYQFRRTVLFRRLLLAYPFQLPRIKLEARIDIPPFYRAYVWAALLDLRADVRAQYQSIDKETPVPADRQLEVDVPRCHQYDELLSSPDGHNKLKRVLKAWLAIHPQYVYWQGLDSLAAPFVHLNFNNEAFAFGCLTAFIEKYLYNFFFKDNTPVIQEYLAVFSHLICFHDPELSNHLENIGFVPDLYAIPWFLTMFAHVFPLHKIFHLWDTLLLGNSSFPLFIGVSVLTQLRENLLQFGFNECILQFSDMPDIDMTRCVQDSIRMFQCTPRSASFRQHSPPVKLRNGQSPQTRDAKADMLTDPISLAELRVERCPRISVDDLIDLCHLDSSSVQQQLQRKVNVLVIDVRNVEDYRKGTVPDSVNIPHQTAIDSNGSLIASHVMPIVNSASNRYKLKVVLGGRGLYAVQFANGLVNHGVSRVCVLHRGIESLRGTSMLVVPSADL